MEIEKIKRERYKVFYVFERPFMTFGRFREIRQQFGLSLQKKCFYCERNFRDKEDIYFISTTKGNKLVCEDCYNTIKKQLEKERENGNQDKV